jgi:hypothetical protein
MSKIGVENDQILSAKFMLKKWSKIDAIKLSYKSFKSDIIFLKINGSIKFKF